MMFDFKNYYYLIISNTALKGLVLIIGSIIVAKSVDMIFTFLVKKMVKTTKTTLDDRILQLMHKPIFYSILFIGFMISIKTIGLPAYIDYLFIGILKTMTIIIWLYVVSKILVMSMEWASRQTAANKILQKNTVPMFNNLGKIAIGLLGIYFIFLSWDININGILASAGVLGVVLGLAAKDTVSNFFAGVFLMADAPFKEGDYILLDTGERGYVKKMGLRSTRFMTRDDIEITIPNSVIAASKIVNESGGPGEIERVRVTLMVAYDSDLDIVRNLLINIAKKENNVMSNPEPRVRFREFADHGLRLQLLFWIQNPEIRGRTIDAVNTEIYKQISKLNITIPYPTMNIHLSKRTNRE
ncbi:MAG: mechanosensitive ion channel family protein [Candidatus Neomarinimicrobiota bacterium]